MSNILYIVGLVCCIWVIYEVWFKQKMDTVEKIIWTVCALFFNIITAVVFYFMKKK